MMMIIGLRNVKSIICNVYTIFRNFVNTALVVAVLLLVCLFSLV